MRHLYKYNYLLLFLLLSIVPFALQAQTPGLIYKPATNGGNMVLDPNGDGYISAPRIPAGFAGTRDEGPGFSEITYRPFPALSNEVLGDLTTGASGGHTDLAPPNYAGSTGSPISAYYNGTHVMFRVRLGGSSTSSKGYSVLIDSNKEFYNPSSGQAPTSTINPGFEFEVVFASNFDVAVYDHRTVLNGGPKIWSGSADQFSQRAVAASTGSSNPDYFYDFYVPLSAFPGINADTPLRMSGITVTSAQSGLTGTVSDVGGVNFAAYNHNAFNAWVDLINNFPPTSLNQIQSGEFAKIAATAPVVTTPIAAGNTTITGTSVEAAGSTIHIYRNGAPTPIGTTTVNSSGSWSITVAVTLLIAGDKITATVTPTTKTVSPLSNEVTVTAAAVCTAVSAPTLTGMSSTTNNKYAAGTTPYVGRQRISLYIVTVNNGIHTYSLEGTYIFTTTTANAALPTTSDGMSSISGTVSLSKSGNYVVTTTPVDANGNATGCESVKSNQLCFQNGGTSRVNSYKPTITSVTGNTGLTYTTLSEIPAGIIAVTGTLSSYASGISVILFKNTVQTTYRVNPTSTNWSINTTGLTLAPGDVLNVRVEETLSCGVSLSATSNFATVKETSATPVINPGPYCGNLKAVSGTSSEPGSVITIFTGGTTTNLTGVVASTGIWTVDVSSLNNGTGIAPGVSVTARAKTAGKATSVFSNAVSSSAATPIPSGATFTINTPVYEPLPDEQLVTLRGTGPASTSTTVYKVSVSISGTLFPSVTTTATGTWELSGIGASEVYTGAVISATFSSSDNSCPSAPVSTTVQCRPPSSNFTTTLSSSSICYNTSVSVTLSGSEKGVSYRLTIGGNATGSSVIGTGSAITLTSGLLTASTSTLSVRAADVGSDCVTTGIGGNKSVTVSAAPAQPTSLTSSVTSGCSSVTTNITLNGPTSGFTYQLINANSKATLGSPLTAGSTSAITLASGIKIYATTTFGVLITPNTANACTSESDKTVTVTVTEGPSLTQAVTIDKPTPCSGEQVTISVKTEYNSGYTYVIKDDLNNIVGTSFSGTGAVISRTTTYAGGVTEKRTFRVEVTGGCATNMALATTVTATPTTAAVTANAGPPQEVCGTVTLDGNYASPGVGTWTKTAGPEGGSITNVNDPKTTVTGLPSGIHEFAWTIVTNCGTTNTSSQSKVQITVNCPAQYIVMAPKYASQYRSGEILASASDTDNGIKAAMVVAGTLPSWAELLTNGNVALKSGATPIAGTYTFTSRTTDSFNRTTDTPLSLTVYDTEPAITPLPVELVYFAAFTQKGQVNLNWLTASEKDNKEFMVQRSADGKVFEHIGTVEGSGNSSLPVRYSFIDKTSLTNTTYYRLKQIDFDGKHAYSNVIAVSAKGIAANMQLQVYPNPFSSELHVTVTAMEDRRAAFQLIDLQGRVMHTGDVELHSGLNELTLPLRFLKNGMYILKLSGNGINKTVKVLKN